MIDLGVVKPGKTIRIPWGSYDGATGASEAASNFADADILVYKDGSTTQRSSASGITATTSFDGASLVAINLISINLADNTDAGFYSAGSEYLVLVGPVTVDAQTVYFPAARFTIGLPDAVLNTTIATVASQTSFTLTEGPAEDDALNGCVVYIHDVASAVQGGFAVIHDYTGASKTVTLEEGTTFTVAATDNISVLPMTNVARLAGFVEPVEWVRSMAWVGSAQAGTLTTTQATTNITGLGNDIFNNRWAIYWQSGAAAYQMAVVTDYDSASGMFTWSPALTAPSAADIFALWPITGGMAVGNRTGDINGRLTVATLVDTTTNLTNLPSIPANWITAAGITDGALTAAKFAAGAFDAVWTVAARTLTAFDASFKTGYALSAAGVQAVWDALTAALTTAGSIGKLLVDNVNATISSRAAGTLFTGITSVAEWLGLIAGKQTGNTTARTELRATGAGSGTFDETTDSNEALRDVVGTAGAGLTAVPWNATWDAEVESEVLDALNTILADSIPADGTLPTMRQALYMLTQFMVERSVSGTTLTVKKADGSTTLFTCTLSDATTPTSITRAT